VANESHFSKVSGFGLAFFNEHFRSKDYDIFDSTLGTLVFSKISDLLDKVQLAKEPMINN
jgi:hypothetical protein